MPFSHTHAFTGVYSVSYTIHHHRSMAVPTNEFSRLSIDNDVQTIESPFLRLPYELRLAIYEYLLFPSETSAGFTPDRLLPIPSKYVEEPDPFVLTVETIHPSREPKALKKTVRRSRYNAHTGTYPNPQISSTRTWLHSIWS